MEEYYHLSPVVLTDELFFSYQPDVLRGGLTGTAAQRNAAYLWAEQRFIEFAGCPIYATTVTGTFRWPLPGYTLPLRFAHVQSIDAVTVISNTQCNCTLTREDGCGIIVNSGYGYVDLRVLQTFFYNACGRSTAPYQMEVAYTAGFPTGVVAADTSLHMALSMAASIFLNEILDPAANEGGHGDPGVKSVSSLGYSVTLKETKAEPWGQSAKAAMVGKIIEHYRKPYRALALPSWR
jgi:hypothetical protein